MKTTLKPKRFPLLALLTGFLPVFLLWLLVVILNHANPIVSLGILSVGLITVILVIWAAFRSNCLELDEKEIKLKKLLSPTVTIPINDIKSFSLYKNNSYGVLSVAYIKNGKQKVAALGNNIIYAKDDLSDFARKVRQLNSSISITE